MEILNKLKKVFVTPTPAPIKKTMCEIGDSGTSIYDGIIEEEYNSDLQGNDGITIYEKMRKSDATVKASLLVCTLPIRAANWYIEPADEDKQNKDVAEFVENNLFDGMSITWDDFLRQALLMLPFGVMLFEKVFKIEDGKILYKKFAPRLPKGVQTWETIDKKDGITWNKIDGKDVSIPIEKLLIFVNEKEGDNWWGNSVLRASYKHWHFKDTFYKLEAVAFERQGLGIPYANMPKGAGDAEDLVAEKVLRNMRVNEKAYALIPDGYEMGFFDMKGSTTKSPKEAIMHHNREIVLAVLAQFLELGATASGSRALSEDHSSLFYLSLEAISKHICDILNNYAIPQLVDLNFTVKEYPKLKFSKIGSVDANALSTAIQRLTQAGALKPDDKLERHLRSLFDLPEAEEVEEVKKKPKEKELKKKANEMRFKDDFKGWRELTFAEKKVRFSVLQNNFDKNEAEFIKVTTEILEKSKSKYLKEFETALKKKDKVALRNIALKYQGEYRGEITTVLKKTYDVAKTNTAREMGVTTPATKRGAIDRMDLQADMIAKKHADDIVYVSKKAAVENLGKGKSLYQTMGAVELAIDSQIVKMTRDTGAIIIGGSINQGRRAVHQKYEHLIYALQRSEILDKKTCNFCLSVDGRVFEKRDPFTRNDIFHSNCRGIWVEVLKDEEELPKITGAPKVITDRFDKAVNEIIQPKKPIVKKSSAAAAMLKK